MGSRQKTSSASCHLTTLEDLDRTIANFWQIENNYGRKEDSFSPEERECESLFQETTVRNEEGRFVVKLPARDNVLSQLGDSREIAERRFFALERRLAKQPEIYNEYRRFMCEYQNLNHMHSINEKKDRGEDIRYYLPHHAVLKDTSTTTRLRVVFDASCKTHSGKSLNDALLVGPIIQQDLFSILTRFRTFRFALTADIAKMYRQVLVHPSQRSLQCILWRDNPQQKLETFELATVTYGTAPASFLAIRSLHKLAQDSLCSYPIAAKIVLRDFYVDDMLSGASTLNEALEIKSQSIALLKEGGFDLRKWFSNDARLRDNNVAFDKEIKSGSDHIKTRALGVLWNCEKDSFNFTNSNDGQPLKRLTKRTILSKIALIFDPLGFLGPVIVIGKLVMQELWQLQIDWDESVPLSIDTKWRDYERQLSCLSNFEIPRKIVVDDANLIELHGFADASQHAYGACVYLRSSARNGEFVVQLIASKSRVAPIKSLSIPRLELCGALLLAQLVEKLKGYLDLQIDDTYYWTDSSIVIHWLRGTSRDWTTFVSNRVGEIQTLTNIKNWHHVSSMDNPADPLSRGVMPEGLSQLKIWWHGPDWLAKLKRDWPTSSLEMLSSVPERKRPSKAHVVHAAIPQTEFDIFDRYSNYEKLLRICAYCLRFSNAVKVRIGRLARDHSNNNLIKSNILCSNDELENAELTLVKVVQRKFFKDEINDISKFGRVSKKSSTLKLNPFLDAGGILRVGGRLRHADLPYDAKHPILLPARHSFTRLIVIHEHNRLLHAGAQMTLSSIRQKFWPCSGRSVVRDITSKCVTCFRNAPRASKTLMGDLPEARVSVFKRAFEKCGIDYAGPMYYKEGQRKNSRSVKCFIAIFVCFATKAVHIELVGDLTTESFLNAFKRFISRRGRPSDVYSDNELDFVEVERQLSELYNILNNEESRKMIVNIANGEHINWHFIPPKAPHMGGLWEAAVKAAKYHVKRIVGEASLRYDEFSTLLVQIEAILNSRPLTPLSVDPTDLSTLTAGHFLTGSPITSYPEPSLEHLSVNRLSRWQRVEQLRQQFWRRWTKEYLHTCQQRTKWNIASNPITVGQLVMIREDNLPPLVWVLGRILEVYPGDDDIVRTVLVRTTKGNYKRAITKLCVLPIE